MKLKDINLMKRIININFFFNHRKKNTSTHKYINIRLCLCVQVVVQLRNVLDGY